ncbi:MAG: dihydropteroate synthase [Candidatus Omnitrophica bacterium]|nr:dihydropteroate synthase [Candidatus Omnitrophota bacterium]
MRIFRFTDQNEVRKSMQNIGVDPYGIKIMLPKALAFTIRLNAINNVTANILKQEMLSLGGDAAVARGSLTGKTKKTDILLFGQLRQLKSLADKLKFQPFGLRKLGVELDENIENYTRDNFILGLREHTLNLSQKTQIMGIINLTPDSFSGDGLYKANRKEHLKLVLEKAQKMSADGADIIDLGGQSSRPGAKAISTKEELLRTAPAVKLLAKKITTPISIDTTKPEVAEAALEAGAQIINDISGLRNKRMIKVAAKYKAAVVIMHMLGLPVNMQKKIAYHSLIDDITAYLKTAIESACSGGINPDKIIIDPGLGFGKTKEHNLAIMRHLADFKVLGKPILIGPSRKSFIGKVLGTDVKKRTAGSLAASVMAALNGANILRVHDVKETNQSLKIVEAIKNADA